jgi:hypothetical protein
VPSAQVLVGHHISTQLPGTPPARTVSAAPVEQLAINAATFLSNFCPACQSAESPQDAAVVLRQRHPLVDVWLEHRAANSIRAYELDLRQWTMWLCEQRTAISPMAPATLGAYLQHFRERGASARSVERKAASIRALLRDLGLLTAARKQELAMIARHCHVARSSSRRLTSMPLDVLNRFIDAIDPHNPRDVRDVALAALFLDTMARPAEVLGLYERGTWVVPPANYSDLTRCRDGSGRLRVQTIDSRRSIASEPIYLSRRVMDRIDAWTEISEIRFGPIFRSFRYRTTVHAASSAFPANRLGATLRRLAKLAGLRQRITSACLRACTVNEMLKEGFHVDDVRRAARTSTLRVVGQLHAGAYEPGTSNDVLRRLEAQRQSRSSRKPATSSNQLELPGL